jgi:hypothetical protein
MDRGSNDSHQQKLTHLRDLELYRHDLPIPLVSPPVSYINKFGGIRHGFNTPCFVGRSSRPLPSAESSTGGVVQECNTSQMQGQIDTLDQGLQSSSMINHEGPRLTRNKMALGFED